MWCLAFLTAFHGFHFNSVNLPGKLNEAADALSCNNLTLFHSLLPQALQESIIPPPPIGSSAAGIRDSRLGFSHLHKAVQFLFGQGIPLQCYPHMSQAENAIAASAGSTSSSLSHQ